MDAGIAVKSVKKPKEKRKDIEYCHACRYEHSSNNNTFRFKFGIW